MPYKASYEEDGFLRQVGVGPEEGEPLADNCSLVLVWHTQTYNSYRQGFVCRMSKKMGSNFSFLSGA